jgi:uncharacterized protein
VIRRLVGEDNEVVQSLLLKEKEYNLFILGDIENYGYDKDFQKLWGEFDSSGALLAVLLKYHASFIFYSRENFDVEAFSILMKNEGFRYLSGCAEIIEKFSSTIDFKSQKNDYFCKMDKDSFKPFETNNNVNTLNDLSLELIVDGVLELFTHVEEFENHAAREVIHQTFFDRTGRVFFIKKNGIFISMAQTSAENSSSAMVVSVCTHPEHRFKGYSSACLIKLCKTLLDEGKTLCLFYDNPAAGTIYKRLGFYDIGSWSMYLR